MSCLFKSTVVCHGNRSTVHTRGLLASFSRPVYTGGKIMTRRTFTPCTFLVIILNKQLENGLAMRLHYI